MNFTFKIENLKLRFAAALIFVTLISNMGTINLSSLASQKAAAASGINKQINFQAHAIKTDGSLLADGNYDFEFKIYTTATGGTASWTEDWNAGSGQVSVQNGLFRVGLGSHTAFPGSVDFNSDSIYLGINMAGDGEMSPRVRFTSVPQAFDALKVNGLTVTASSGTLTIPDGKTISFGNDFTTAGTSALTLTTTATTNATLPAGTVTLADTASAQTLSNKTISAAPSITSTGTVSATGTPTASATSSLVSLGSGIVGGSASGTYLGLNAASGYLGNLVDLQVNGTSKFSVSAAGALTLGSALTVANGGTGATSATLNGVLYGNGSSAIGATAAGTSGQCLVATSAAAPSWGSCASSGSGVTLQAAYDNGATIVSADNKDLAVTLANTATDSNFIVNIATGSTGQFKVQGNGTDKFYVDSSGNTTLTGTLTANSLNITGGASIGQSGQNITVNSSIVPSTNGTLNVGSSTNHFASGYFDNLTVGTTNTNGTTATSFTIDTGQVTNNTDNQQIRFYLGPTINGYAALQYTGATDDFTLYSRITSSTLATLNVGTLSATSANATGVTTASSLAVNANSLTSGTGLYVASSTLTSGKAIDVQVSGTAAASNTQTALNVATAGANATSTQTTYGVQVANTHTGTTSTNIGGYFTASGGTTNYAIQVNTGTVVLQGNASAAAWGVAGVNFRTVAATYTDTSSSGTVANAVANSFGIPTFAASSSTTYTAASTLYIAGAPTAGSNVTLSNPAALVVATGNVGLGTTTPAYPLVVSSNGGASSSDNTGDLLFVTAAPGGSSKSAYIAVENTHSNWKLGLPANTGGNFVIRSGSQNVDRLTVAYSQLTATQFTFTGGNMTDTSGTTNDITLASLGITPAAGSAVYNVLNLPYTINASGAQTGSVTGIKVNATETALNGFTHNLIDLQVASASKFLVSNAGNVSHTAGNATGTTTSSALSLAANSLTTGTGLYVASSTLTSGKAVDVQVSGTAAAASQTALNILTAGANATDAITTYGAQISNTHTTSSSTNTNVGLYVNASGGTTNYGLIVNAGRVGVGTTAPVTDLHLRSATSTATQILMASASGTADAVVATIGAVREDTVAAHTTARYSSIEFLTGQTNYYTGGQIVFKTGNTTDSTVSAPVEAARFDNFGKLGVGTGATVSAKLHVLSTTEQLRLGYDASNYFSTTVGSTGGVTFDAVGAGAGFTFSDAVSSTGSGTFDSLSVGGGYGSTGVTISNAGTIQANGNLTVDGTVTGGTYNSQTISSAANFTGTVTVATSLTVPTILTASGDLALQSATGIVNLNKASTQNILRVYDSSATKYAQITHDGTDGILSSSSGELQLSGQGTNQFIIGDVGTAVNLVFEESSTISGQGGNTITLGQSGDIFNLNTSGAVYNVGTLTSTGATISTSSTSTTALVINGPTSLASNLIDAQVNGSSKFSVSSAGAITAVGLTNTGNESLTGNLAVTSSNTTQTGTSAGLSVVGNSLTTGNLVDISSSSVTTGNVVKITSTSTAAASNTLTALNLAVSGANGTAAQTVYGLQSTVTNTNGTSGTNIAAYLSASGATTANYALIVPGTGGSVGIGTTAPVGSVNIAKTTNPTSITRATNFLNFGGTAPAVNTYYIMGLGYGSTHSPAYLGYVETDDSGSTIGDLIFGTRSVTTESLATERLRITSAGTISLPATNATGVTTASALAVNANSLTTGTGLYVASSTLTSGLGVDIQVSGTAAAASQTALNILTSGATATNAITTYGAQISNTHANATSGTNVGLYLNASGATTANYALQVAAGTSLFGGLVVIGTGEGTGTVTGNTIRAPLALQQTAGVAGADLTVAASNAVAGSGTAGAVAGGALALNGGNAARLTSGSANGGAITITGGSAPTAASGAGTGGAVTIKGGAGGYDGVAGAVIIQGGTANTNGTSQTGAAITLTPGTGAGNGAGGNLNLNGGTGSGIASGGNIVLQAGITGSGDNTSIGGGITLTARAGSSNSTGNGANGGAIPITLGAGGVSDNAGGTGGNGGTFTLQGGAGGVADSNSGGIGGNGSAFTFTSGAGGNATGGGGTRNGGNSGNITIQTGAVGTGASANGTAGTITLGIANSAKFVIDASGNSNVTGNLAVTSANVSGVTTASALALNANSLTTGTGLYVASSTLSAGKAIDIQVSGTAAASNTQTAVNIATAGANATSTQTTYGLQVANTHTGTASTNTAAYFTASGGTTNYAINVNTGTVILQGNASAAAWGTAGIALQEVAATYTDTSTAAGGTVSPVVNSFATPTLAANCGGSCSSNVTMTNAATVYIQGAPSAGTNVTLTTPYALYVAGGSSFFGGSVTINSITPLTIGSGASTLAIGVAAPSANVTFTAAGSGTFTFNHATSIGGVLTVTAGGASITGGLTAIAGAVSNVPLIAKGTGSQTADLLQVQDSTTAIKFAIDVTGKVASGESLPGLPVFGVEPDSGADPGDLLNTDGPLKPSAGAGLTLNISAGAAYTADAVSSQTKIARCNLASDTTVTLTDNATEYVYVTADGAASTTGITCQFGHQTTVPTFSAGKPVLVIAKTVTSGAAISSVADVRPFTGGTLNYAQGAASTTYEPGSIVRASTATDFQMALSSSNSDPGVSGIVVVGNDIGGGGGRVIFMSDGYTWAKSLTTAAKNNCARTTTTAGALTGGTITVGTCAGFVMSDAASATPSVLVKVSPY